MSRVIYKTQVALNGLIEMPGKPPDWVVADEELFRYMNTLERQIGGYLWGRQMYENNHALWSTVDPHPLEDYEVEYRKIWTAIPTIVFSSTLERVEGNARLERGDPVAVVKRLKEQSSPERMSIGGVRLASTLMQAGLVDEYHIFFQPIILGSGRPIYPPLGEAIPLKLVDTHIFRSGIVYLRYER